MELIQKDQNQSFLESIKPGQCFIYKNEVYLKIKETKETFSIGNVVRLRDGLFTGISPSFSVTPVDAKVYFENPIVIIQNEVVLK